MKRYLIITLLLISGTCFAQQVQLVDRNWITYISQNNSDTTYVINFWATWCKPCIEEIPAFEKVNHTYKDKKVKVLMVSCDFKKQLDTRVVPFIKDNHMKSTVLFMNESDPNTWIDKLDSEFSGAIPATLIINGQKHFRHFKEGETTFEELTKLINPLIN